MSLRPRRAAALIVGALALGLTTALTAQSPAVAAPSGTQAPEGCAWTALPANEADPDGKTADPGSAFKLFLVNCGENEGFNIPVFW